MVQSHVSVVGSCPSFASFSTIANQRGSTDALVAIYKGFPVSVHRSSKAEVNLTKDDLIELFNVVIYTSVIYIPVQINFIKYALIFYDLLSKFNIYRIDSQADHDLGQVSLGH